MEDKIKLRAEDYDRYDKKKIALVIKKSILIRKDLNKFQVLNVISIIDYTSIHVQYVSKSHFYYILWIIKDNF